MSKILNQPVSVRLRKGLLSEICWRKVVFIVIDCVDRWRESGRWWKGEGEKDFFQVETDKGAFIIYRENLSHRWFLYKVLD